MPKYSEKTLHDKAERYITVAFKTLWFSDTNFRDILYDSYIANLHQMNAHMRATHTDIYDYYFRELRKILLQTPGVRNYHRHQR